MTQGAESPTAAPASPPTYAAVDLGSNSFHMLVARVTNGVLERVDRIREPVRLAAGLDAHSVLSDQAIARAVASLQRINQRLRHIPAAHIRAVGTDTLRKARNAAVIMVRFREALGHPIDVISGAEEARLVYLGVSHSVATTEGLRLVVDIGGGSTECVLGQKFEARSVHSFHMGCVNFTRRYFPGGDIDGPRWEAAVDAARLELQPLQKRFRNTGWSDALGSSGTIRSISSILAAHGWTDGRITLAGLHELRDRMLAAGNLAALNLMGLREDRRPILAGGVAVLYAVFKAFRVESMQVAPGALREGVLYDLLGRLQEEDVRERTVAYFEQRYQIDVRQSARVARLAAQLFEQSRDAWQLPDASRSDLVWAARLHEIGLFVSYTRSHQHGAYLIAQADMPGFSLHEQQLIASLVRNSRRGFDAAAFAELLPAQRALAPRLAVLLRLAVRLSRSRSDASTPNDFVFAVDGTRLTLGLRSAWLDEHPLTRVDIEHEQARLRAAGYALQLVDSRADHAAFATTLGSRR